MSSKEESKLGLPPMELAEKSPRNSNERNTGNMNLCSRVTTKVIIAVTILLLVGVGSCFFLLQYLKNEENPNKTEIIVNTGTREASNITIQNKDIDIFLQLKNQTVPTTIRTKREIKKKAKRENSIEKIVNNFNENDIKYARELIINYNEPCQPGNENEICKNLVQQLDAIKNVPNREKPFENMFMEIRGLESDKTNIDPIVKENRESTIKITKRDTIGSTNVGENNFQTTPSFEHLGKAAQDSFTPMNYYQNQQQAGLIGHYHRANPAISENCLLARLLQHHYPHGYLEHYDSIQPPVLPPAPCPPNQPYVMHHQTRESVEHERKPHPQDIGIYMRYKTESSTATSRVNTTNRSAGCGPGMISCISDDQCVMESQLCDGIVNCHDVSDEIHCSCKSIVHKSRLCDGYYDCPFGEDEMGCHGCDELSFSCENLDLNSQANCFTKDQRCNGIRDCPNNKDEIECNMLAPSLHEKPLFAVSHTEGFLQRNYRGNWYAVCRNPYMWAHDACLRETGLITRPPYLQLIQIDPSLKISYLNHETGHLMQMSDSCYNSSAIYVVCPALLCGTRVLTTSQLIRENGKYESRLYGRNKRYLCSVYPTSPHCSDKETKREQNESVLKTILETNGRQKRAEGRVVGGKPSQPAAWPWMVALYRDGAFHCGGVVLTQRWVMSAAHCVHKFWEHHYEVQVGMLRRFSYAPQEQNHQVSHVIVNQYYDRLDMKNDLSLLRVKPSIQFSRWIRPICLPGPDSAGPDWMWGPPPDTICTTVGWGATFEQGPDPDHMREVEVPIWEKCKHREDRAGKELCAGPIEGGKDACQGDSGGPLLCKNPQNPQQWYIAGIVSHGDGCARYGEPGVYTRVSLFVKWIRYHTNAKSLPTIRPKQECPGFRCVSGITRCLARKKICDKIVDCLNGEDEIDCNYERSSKNDNDNILATDNSSVLDMTSKEDSNRKIFLEQRTAATLPNDFSPEPTPVNINTTSTAAHLEETSTTIKVATTAHPTPYNEIHDGSTKYHSSSEQDSSEEIHSITETYSNKNIKTNNTETFEDVTKFNIEVSSEPNSSISVQDLKTKDIANKSFSILDQVVNNERNIIKVENEIASKSTKNDPNDHKSESRRTDIPEEEIDLQITTLKVFVKESSVTTTMKNDIKNHNVEHTTTTSTIGSATNTIITPDDYPDKTIDDNAIVDSVNNIKKDKNKVTRGQGNKHGIVKESVASVPNVNDSVNSKENKQNKIAVEEQEGKDFVSPLIDDSVTKELNKLKDTILNGQASKPYGNKLEPAKIKKVNLEPHHFNCKRISQIIPYKHRCDHKADCEDGTDEFGCTCVDYISTFDNSLLCDGHVDCADGQDETNCYECTTDYFFCKWSQNCLPSEHVCDGIPQCPHGEDEMDCYALTNGINIVIDYAGKPLVNLEGYLTKKNNNRWNIVCEDNITMKKQEEAATHTCRYLGFSSANRFLVKYLNIKENDIKSVEKFIRKRDTSTIPIQFTYKDSQGPEARHIVIKEPQVIKEECVPNITKTCMSLYVYCDHGLYTKYPDIDLNDYLYRSSRSNGKMLPWVAKVYVEGDYRCSGVLIDLSWVLISESCMWDTSLVHHYVTVVLGSYRTLSGINGPNEQTYYVNDMIKIYNGRLTLLHLSKKAYYSSTVKPMITSTQNPHMHNKKDICVAVAQDFNNNTVLVYLEEMINCKSHSRCFKKVFDEPQCDQGTKIKHQWAGIISCHAEQGWYPAATFVDNNSECSIGDILNAYDIEEYKSEIKRFICEYKEKSNQTSAEIVNRDNCDGERCTRGRCIKYSSVCNGIKDCEDGYDETDEVCHRKETLCSTAYHEGCECKAGQLKCRNGQCISKEYFSDGNDDCGDGTDEPSSNTTCSLYLARTAPRRLCDGILHCADRSDEDPMFCKCFARRSYKCGSSEECVAPDLVCDGVTDCRNGEDERTCLALRAPEGTVYGTGEVIERAHGEWHTKCYSIANHTKTGLEKICKELGFQSGHAKQLKYPEKFLQPYTKVILDEFTQVDLNRNTSVKLRNNDLPLARVVIDYDKDSCHRLFIECL